MRFAIYIILLMLACYGIYSLVKHESPPTPVPAQSESQTHKANKTPGVVKVTCPVCYGETFIKARKPGSEFDLKQTCPVCLGKGFRDVTVPEGKRLCPDCKGMGSVSLRANVAQKVTCARCSASGTIPIVGK